MAVLRFSSSTTTLLTLRTVPYLVITRRPTQPPSPWASAPAPGPRTRAAMTAADRAAVSCRIAGASARGTWGRAGVQYAVSGSVMQARFHGAEGRADMRAVAGAPGQGVVREAVEDALGGRRPRW